MDKLKPCPFCSSEDLHITNILVGHNDYTYAVKCWHCGATGGDAYSVSEAIENWNTRKGE